MSTSTTVTPQAQVIYHHVFLQPDPRLDQIMSTLQTLVQGITAMSASLTAEITQLQTDVTNQTTVINSAVALINGFAAQLAQAVQAASAAGATPEQLAALTTLGASITASTQSLADAVSANTPSAQTPPATPAPTPTPTPAPDVTNP